MEDRQTPQTQALVKRSTDNALMPPPPPPKRIKRPAKVLDEDTYTDALSHIIARDFFPGLLETQVQQEYLDAVDSKNSSWISNAGQRLSEVMTPGPGRRGRRGVSMTPSRTPAGDTPLGHGGATPMSVAGSDITTASTNRPQEVDTDMSLAKFQEKYTSEDNESFYKLLDKQNSKHRDEYGWMWNNNKIPGQLQITQTEQREKQLLTQGSSTDGQSSQQLISTDLAARPAKPDAWKHRPDNQLMFEPASVEDTHETIQQRAEASSKAAPKAIIYGATRLNPIEKPDSGSQVPPSPSLSAVRDAIAGRPRLGASEMGSAIGGGGSETPRVNGYAFVDPDEPEPEYQDTEYDFSNLLPAADASPNPFTIAGNRKREDLHHRMVDKVAKAKRVEKVINTTRTPVPRFASSPMIGRGFMTPGTGGKAGSEGLTPAAHRLLQSVGKTPLHKSRLAGSSAGGWTPKTTPRRKK